ncbi:tRNA (adenosine(37)-N6)-threonylcarbamoyltransferase complex ATPase subunit type 1 TsaE, partial [Gluconobacter sp.]|uniref:tRNA (adenosine(37)-N6)-threonylcarbamoyltransferase complex ATPase subunit type 1 TsaE n=1 Tax=Gluconobacter sp. TaxID=1876758 RepID=UPI0039EAC476
MQISLPDQTSTEHLAARIATLCAAGDCIALSGGLGAGKSTFARAFLRFLAGDATMEVPSPSFALVQPYDTSAGPVFHYDLWRLDGSDALYELAWDEACEGIMLAGRASERDCAMTVVTIAGTEPFLDRVAHEWLKQDPAAGTDGPGLLLVPSRRAGRALMEAFLRVLDGKASLLPRIVAINDVDEEALASIGIDVSLPPAVEPQRRLAVLSMLILQTPIVSVGVDKTKGIDRAWPLAKALADLMDEAERSGVDLAKSLPDAVEERFSEHWQQTLKFLEIVTTIWPKWLEEEGLSNPVARQVARLKAQAAAWQHVPPHTPVWAVGFADGSAAVSDVLAAVATLPAGLVILPGVDLDLPQAMWEALPASHPQAGLKEILADLGLTRDNLTDWDGGRDRARERLMRGVMLPEQGITAWGRDLNPRDISGLSLLPAQDQQQEAQSIALILRNVVSVSGQTCALVTPDRSLAQRVGTELLRFGIYADDSAGEPLAQTPAAVFLR